MALRSKTAWENWFKKEAKLPATQASDYAELFHNNRINETTLPDITKADLHELGITTLGDVKHNPRGCQTNPVTNSRRFCPSSCSSSNTTYIYENTGCKTTTTNGWHDTPPIPEILYRLGRIQTHHQPSWNPNTCPTVSHLWWQCPEQPGEHCTRLHCNNREGAPIHPRGHCH